MTEPIRLARPDVGEAELAAVAEVVRTGQLTMGPKVEEFEAAVAQAVGTAHAAAVSSGTAALHLALLALEIGSGDEVIVPAYTFPATANAVELCGAKAVLVDIDPDTFNLDVAAVAAAVTPRTRAVMAVHLFGRPVEWEALQTAVPQEVVLLEDAAGALGAQYRGTLVRRARRRGVSLVPPAQDRDDGGGRRGHDGRSGARRRRSSSPAPRLGDARRHALSGIQLPTAGSSLRRRHPAAGAARGAAGGSRAGRRLVRGAARAPRADTERSRGRPSRLAGLRRPARPPRRRARGASRRGNRGADRHVGAPSPRAVQRTRAHSPAPTEPSSARSHCRSRRRRPRPRSSGSRMS